MLAKFIRHTKDAHAHPKLGHRVRNVMFELD